jgi:HAD superfamily hydrolase (TIGR01450 family)
VIPGTAAGDGQAARPAATGRPRGCDRAPSEVYDVALLDLDGVVYLGGKGIPGAPQALTEARRHGMRLAFVTNNASRSPAAIAQQLTSLGIAASPADIVTSAQAAARLVAERLPRGSAVLVAGGIGLRLALRERGMRPVSTAAEKPVAVVQGYAPDIGYSLLAEAALAIRGGAWYVASNADATLPSARGPLPGNGALIQLLVTATGRQPVVAGKPEPPLHAEAVRRTGARYPLIVGDRLDTDIEGAVRVGADSLLVLTGVTQPADAVLAPPHRRPVYIARDLAGLLEPQPEVSAADGAFSCRGWTARLTRGPRGVDRRPAAAAHGAAGRLELSGSGNPIDGLRALCAAAWSADAAVTAEMAQSAIGKLGLPADVAHS